MSAFMFGAKRAFHATQNFMRPYINAFGLTSARYDMLNAIRRFCALECRGQCCRVMQRDLRRLLGVSAPTISRMIRALESLGLVRRERSERDRRQLRVFLTPAGRARVDRAFGDLELSGATELAFECVLSPPPFSKDSYEWQRPWERLAQLDLAENVLRRIRTGFGDRATLHYPWHPDD